ncbi:hypothetical protein [Variovorax sp. OV329]|uniref:hypothetical protein n=1 Tax=Variovorax sp. OV329 TaxID=1882825 RepID=UPI0008F22950|nr:hypothetical protein [Variovorax sp. OV329]SFM98695.1 hypothetical protein SAMN05444747_112124 [Variovorax sp. OV329]
MNRIVRNSIATGLVSLAVLGASAASAQVWGSVSINLPGPPIAVVPAPPVYGRPAPVYVQPAPRAYGPAYGHGHGHYDRGGYYGNRGYYSQERYRGARWDRDGDGVPNRHDRRPDNPYRY